MHDSTNQCLHRSYTCHSTLLVNVDNYIYDHSTLCMHTVSIMNLDQAHTLRYWVVHAYPLDLFYSYMHGSKRCSSSLASTPVRNTLGPIFDVAWQSHGWLWLAKKFSVHPEAMIFGALWSQKEFRFEFSTSTLPRKHLLIFSRSFVIARHYDNYYINNCVVCSATFLFRTRPFP